MSWPTPQEYNEAIQNPALCFADAELRDGKPELTPLGLPRPITGNFASVYRLRCPGRDWAVRCFWRDLADTQERYAAISAHLAASHLPYTVGFDFLPQGIRVQGRWYPILKMEWVEGELLHEYVARHLGDRRALLALAERWQRMVMSLERAGIAHGDLQHGNVLVVSGDLKLVDYDGMFVPALAGRSSHELGHQNYQHPGRGERDFGPALDRFAAWVIYLSLLALAAQPELWQRANGGDERLLFGRQDFLDPAHSPPLQDLMQQPDTRLRDLAAQFRSFSALAPGRVPPLPGTADERKVVGRVRRAADQPARPLPGWMRDSAPASPPPAVPAAPRLALLASLGVAAAALLTMPVVGAALAPLTALSVLFLAFANLAMLSLCYRREAAVARRLALRRRERAELRALATIARRADGWERAMRRAEERYERRREGVVRRQQLLQQREARERARVEQVFTQIIELLEEALRHGENRREDRLARALRHEQDRHLKRSLRRRSLLRSSIPHAALPVKLRLWLAGIHSAWDVTPQHLEGLDPFAAAGVLAWRRTLEDQARTSGPRQLPPAVRERLSRRYERRSGRLQGERERAKEARETVLRRADSRYARRYRALDENVRQLEAEKERRRQEIAARMREVREGEPVHHWRLAEVRRQLEPYESATFGRYVRSALRP